LNQESSINQNAITYRKNNTKQGFSALDPEMCSLPEKEKDTGKIREAPE